MCGSVGLCPTGVSGIAVSLHAADLNILERLDGGVAPCLRALWCMAVGPSESIYGAFSGFSPAAASGGLDMQNLCTVWLGALAVQPVALALGCMMPIV